MALNLPNTHTDVQFDLTEFFAGVDEVCEPVAITLGPLGMNVAVDKGFEHFVVDDGVTVAESIRPKQPHRALGAKIIQEAAKKQRDAVGDGTTAVMVLAQAIIKECKKMQATGIKPAELRRGLELGAAKVVKALEDSAVPVQSLADKIRVATISGKNAELGQLIAETIEKVGDDGIVTVEDSKSADTFFEHETGMRFDRGWASQHFVTDKERDLAILDSPHVLITDKPLSSLPEIAKFLETVIFPNTKKLLIIAPEIGGDFLNALVGSKISGLFLPLGVKAPLAGTHQRDFLQDLCALTGAKFITSEANHKFDDFNFTALGQVDRVVSSRYTTTLTGGKGIKEDIQMRIQSIKNAQIDKTLSQFDQEKLKERLGRLTNGIAVIKVGGQTEVEMKQRREKAIDAVLATQAAIKGGIVPGGEIALIEAAQAIAEDNELGTKVLYKALKKPFYRLVENAGYDGGEIFARLSNFGSGWGYDVTDGTYKDLVASGIIDPALVPITAVKTAVSVAVQLIITGASIGLVPDDKVS